MDHNVLTILKTDFEYKPSSKTKNDNNIYLHINFNLPLDSSFANESSIFITTPYGDYLPCKVKYRKGAHSLIVAISSYDNGILYTLHITQNVRSLSMQRLRSNIMYTFIIENSKPYNFTQVHSTIFNAPLADVSLIDRKSLPAIDSKEKLSTKNNFAGIFYVITFIILLVFAQVLEALILNFVALFFLLAASLEFVKTFFTPRGRSVILYNKGVRCYREKDYKNAVSFFEKSFALDRTNSQSKNALNLAFSKYVNNMK